MKSTIKTIFDFGTLFYIVALIWVILCGLIVYYLYF